MVTVYFRGYKSKYAFTMSVHQLLIPGGGLKLCTVRFALRMVQVSIFKCILLIE